MGRLDPDRLAPDAARDNLTRVLLGLRLDGVEYGRCQVEPPWATAFPAQRDAAFHFVCDGGAWLKTADADWRRLEPGDAVLLPRGSAHLMASAPDVPPVSIDALTREVITDNLYRVSGFDRGGARAVRGGDEGRGDEGRGDEGRGDEGRGDEGRGDGDIGNGRVDGRTTMFCCTMRFNLDPTHPLLAMMPTAITAGELARRDPGVPALLDAMEREVALDRIGSCGILARLADVVAASVIRAWVECGCSQSTGWVAAMRSPRLGKVLAAIHADPGRDWTVPELAARMGASRSSFADSFMRIVGESPARYVAKVRMLQARRWIEYDGVRVAVAANRIGYDSEASFSRAFKRIIGIAPGALRGRGAEDRGPRQPTRPRPRSLPAADPPA